MKNTQKELKYGTILSYIYMIIYNVSQLVYTPILLNGLGQNIYGVYSLCLSIISYITMLDFGLGNAVVRYVSIYKNNEDDNASAGINGLFLIIYSIIGILAFLIGIIIVFYSEHFFSSSFTTNEIELAKNIILILSINVAITFPLSVFSSIVTAHEKFIFLRILNIVKTLASTIIMILFLLLGYKAIAVSLITLIVNVSYLIFITIYAFKKLKIKVNFKLKNKQVIKEIFSFSIFAFILLIVDKVNFNVDMVILGKFANSTQLAIYSIASKIFQMFLTISTILSTMLLPHFTELALKNKEDELNQEFLEKSKWQLLIPMYIFTAFIIFGDSFIKIWVGNGYYTSYIITSILMFCAIIPSSLNVANVILQAKNKQKFRSMVLFIILILNIIISIPFCIKYQAIGCTIGTAVTYILGHVIIMSHYFKKHIKLDMKSYYKNTIKIFILFVFTCTLFLGIKLILKANFIINLIILILYLLIVSLVTYKFILNEKEKNMIKRIYKKIRRR